MSSNGRSAKEPIAIPKGATQTDLRLTRHPADTPRGRLHRLAATSVRAADEVKREAKLSKADMAKLRALARRGLALIGKPRTRGERVAAELCSGIDRAIFALTLLDVDAVIALCEGLTITLVQLEAAEHLIQDLETKLQRASREARVAHGDVNQLRTLLAKLHDETARREAKENESSSEWNELTRRRHLTEDEKRTISDPDAR